jgi:hypothetical protein
MPDIPHQSSCYACVCLKADQDGGENDVNVSEEKDLLAQLAQARGWREVTAGARFQIECGNGQTGIL